VGHPLFEADDSALSIDSLRAFDIVNHRYAIHRDKASFVNSDSQSASASQVEAVAMMILTGRLFCFLTELYTRNLIRDGLLRALRPDLIFLRTPVNLILRHNAPRSPLVKAFARALGVDLRVGM
jgi:DNA-binding transcriptional LysR family regulator